MNVSLSNVLPLLVALLAVGIILYLSYLFSRYLAAGASKVNKSKYIKVVDRVVLGQDRVIMIAEIGEKYYVMGSTPHSIEILTELDEMTASNISKSEKSLESTSFKNKLKGMLSKK